MSLANSVHSLKMTHKGSLEYRSCLHSFQSTSLNLLPHVATTRTLAKLPLSFLQWTGMHEMAILVVMQQIEASPFGWGGASPLSVYFGTYTVHQTLYAAYPG